MEKIKDKIVKQFEIIEFHHKGYGVSKDNQGYEIWNALPGEKVEIEFTKGRKFRKKTFLAQNIIKPSKFRVEPIEKDHFLSCSPWQIVDWKAENKFKIEIANKSFKDNGVNITFEDIATDDIQYKYRNKMEYSFYIDDNQLIHLAFHKRGSRGITPIDECNLADDSLNRTAKLILSWVNEIKLPKKSLKTLIVRSNSKGKTVAGLFIKDELSFKTYPKIDDDFVGLNIYYSNHKSPASTADKLLYSDGRNWLEETLNISSADSKKSKFNLKFGLLSFFQINLPLFEKALEIIYSELSNGDELVDLYSGVGSISLPISEKVKGVVLVDNNEESIEFAILNIQSNRIKNAKAICIPAEQLTDIIKPKQVLIVDPPRTGLHPKVVSAIRDKLPNKIIYLSCNPNTQAMDLRYLVDKYKIKTKHLLNFFPRTPHIESLIILEKI